jgi:hypothetical protein
MPNGLRRVRGALGMGLTWGAAWSVAGLVPRWVLGVDADVPFPLVFGVLGFLAGLTFSGLLALTAARRRVEQLSLPRVAAWGAAGGLLLAVLFASVASIGWGDLLALAPTLSLASALSACGSLALARRARRTATNDRGARARTPPARRPERTP